MATRSAIGTAIETIPALIAGSAGLSLLYGLSTDTWGPVAAAVAILYLVPPLLHRAHDAIWPLKAGSHAIVGADYVPWWGSHQLQRLYITFPALEAALRLVPGLFSAWLRLWGAKVGRKVYWTPSLEITDRSLLDIGDGAIFGQDAVMVSHVIMPRDGKMTLYFKTIVVGDGALIGGQSVLGPGAVVKPAVMVRARQTVSVNEVVE
jgi:acetyltransferase-like isoleucine patch superfamily enzyme